jgi:two-component system sensor histidine kinase/response regulator
MTTDRREHESDPAAVPEVPHEAGSSLEAASAAVRVAQLLDEIEASGRRLATLPYRIYRSAMVVGALAFAVFLVTHVVGVARSDDGAFKGASVVHWALMVSLCTWCAWRHRRLDRPYVNEATVVLALNGVGYLHGLHSLGDAALPNVGVVVVVPYLLLPVARARALGVLYVAVTILGGVLFPLHREVWLRSIMAAVLCIAFLDLLTSATSTTLAVFQRAADLLRGVSRDLVVDNARLAEANVRANAASEAKGAFLANMSHEIRTPMNAVLGMTHLALQTELEPKQRGYLEKVHRSAEHLRGIINDILDFSKVEAGKLELEEVEFRLDDVLESVASAMGMRAQDKGIELLFAVDASLPTRLLGDPLRLTQILLNLVSNALKFTERGEIVVGVHPQPAAEGELDTLRFTVRDTGIGMTSEQVGRLFQSFSQADVSTTRKYGGTGLGLAITKQIVELMSGSVAVRSEFGQGSTFEVVLPFGRVARVEGFDEHRALAGIRALVVDDNATARELLTELLRSLGLYVEAAADADAAIALVEQAARRRAPFELAMLDWQMPLTDGLDLARRMQAQPSASATKFIMVTGFSRDDTLLRASRRGVTLHGVLTKPLTPASLLATVERAFARGSLAPSPASRPTNVAEQAREKLDGTRVLLVEDNELNQDLALEILGQAGIEVVIAENGRVAVDLLRRTTDFDGVLMDCQMPVLDGYEATRIIRHELGLPRLPILAMTANATLDDLDRALACGMNDCITKPLDLGSMFDTLTRWIAPSSQSRGRPATWPPAADVASPMVAAVTEVRARSVPPPPAVEQAVFEPEAALRVTMGNTELVAQLFGRFRESHADFEVCFTRLHRDEDFVGARRLVHTLRGDASMLGGPRLARAASVLEAVVERRGAADELGPALAAAVDELAQFVRATSLEGA